MVSKGNLLGLIVPLCVALTVSLTAEGGRSEDRAVEAGGDEFVRQLGERGIDLLCSEESEYLSCLQIPVEQCETELFRILPRCAKKHQLVLPDIDIDREDYLKIFKSYGEEFGSCLLEEHLASGNFNGIQAQECLESK